MCNESMLCHDVYAVVVKRLILRLSRSQSSVSAPVSFHILTTTSLHATHTSVPWASRLWVSYVCSLLFTTLPHVLYALQTLACCLFLMFTLPLHPVVLMLQPIQSGTRSHLAFATLPLPILSIALLKLTASSRPSGPPSGSPKCLRFGHRLTLCTLKIDLLTLFSVF